MTFTPDTVVFDVGGVLLDWNPEHLYCKLIPEAGAREHFLTTVCPPEWNLQQDLGHPPARAVAERQREFPEYAELIAAWWERWDEMLGGAIPGTVGVVDDLRRAGVPTYALTNFAAENWPRACQRFPWLLQFDGIVVSGRERVAKPDPRIYQRLCARYGIEPARAVFIDDRADNIAAAERLGFTGVRFASADALRPQLRDLGLPA